MLFVGIGSGVVHHGLLRAQITFLLRLQYFFAIAVECIRVTLECYAIPNTNILAPFISVCPPRFGKNFNKSMRGSWHCPIEALTIVVTKGEITCLSRRLQ
jgi:hypothetical protein